MVNIEIGNDIDLFIVGTEERAQMIMEFVLVDVLDHTSFRTGNAVTFFVKDAINGDIPVQIILKLHRYPTHVIEGFDEPSKRLSTVMLTDNCMAWSPRDGWNALERILSRAGKRGLRQRTESSNTPLKDFSLISVDFKPVSENGYMFRCATKSGGPDQFSTIVSE
jgi:hypothetical protein